MRASEKLFNRYKYLTTFYANKIFDEHKIGFNKQDLQQELSIKLITSIKSYGKRWSYYRKTGEQKPIPIKFYLKLCMVNKVKDLIKYINREKISYFDDFNFDYGKSENSFIDLRNKNVLINGVDLFQGIKIKEQKIVFSMFLKGYTITHITTLFKKHKSIKPNEIIRGQIDYLKTQKESLFLQNNPLFVQSFDEE